MGEYEKCRYEICTFSPFGVGIIRNYGGHEYGEYNTSNIYSFVRNSIEEHFGLGAEYWVKKGISIEVYKHPYDTYRVKIPLAFPASLDAISHSISEYINSFYGGKYTAKVNNGYVEMSHPILKKLDFELKYEKDPIKDAAYLVIQPNAFQYESLYREAKKDSVLKEELISVNNMILEIARELMFTLK